LKDAYDFKKYIFEQFCKPKNEKILNLNKETQSKLALINKSLVSLKLKMSKINLMGLSISEELLIKQWIPNIKSLSLLYMATRDGFASQDFHKLCDGKAKTLTVITSEHYKRFGGFTPLAWNSTSNWCQDSTNESFLFSLTLKKKMPIIASNNVYAIHCHSGYGPWFGSGNDIIIYSNSHQNNSSNSNLGCCYDISVVGLKYGSTEAQSYLAGSYTFKVLEILVYQVIT